jgi:hypothetical protein
VAKRVTAPVPQLWPPSGEGAGHWAYARPYAERRKIIESILPKTNGVLFITLFRINVFNVVRKVFVILVPFSTAVVLMIMEIVG